MKFFLLKLLTPRFPKIKRLWKRRRAGSTKSQTPDASTTIAYTASLAVEDGAEQAEIFFDAQDGPASFGSLPPEIVELILLSGEQRELFSYPRGRSNDGKRLKNYAKSLSEVCMRWKQLIEDNDRFWETVLDISYEIHPWTDNVKALTERFPKSLAAFKDSLRTSGQSDLIVIVSVCGTRGVPDVPRNLGQDVATHFALLEPHSHQITAMRLGLDIVALGPFISRSLQRFSNLPRLQEVIIWSGDVPSIFPPGTPNLDFSRATAMSGFRLMSVNAFDSIRLPTSLRTLKVQSVTTHIPWSKMRDVLICCPSLAAIELHGVEFSGLDGTSSSTIVHLPNVRLLQLSNKLTTDCDILQRVQAPMLYELRLALNGRRPHGFVNQSFVFPYLPSLCELNVRVSEWDEIVENFLAQTVPISLKKLTIETDPSSLTVPSRLKLDARSQISLGIAHLHLRLHNRERHWLTLLHRFDLRKLEKLEVSSPWRSAECELQLPAYGSGRIQLPSLTTLRMANAGALNADMFCHYLDAPSLRKLDHWFEFFPREGAPFPRPTTKAGVALRRSPTWYNNITSLSIEPIRPQDAYNLPEHPFTLFPAAEEVSLVLYVRHHWNSSLTKFFAGLISRSSQNRHMTKLRTFAVSLYTDEYGKNGDGVWTKNTKRCREVLEGVYRKRAKLGMPLKYIELSTKLAMFSKPFVIWLDGVGQQR